MENIRIRKVKITSDNKIHLAFERKAGMTEDWDEYTMTCSELPRPELYTALAAMAKHVQEICELPEAYTKRIDVRGVTASYEKKSGTMGVVITAQMELFNSSAPLILNAPFKKAEVTGAGDDTALTPACVEALQNLFDECRRYINGERAQCRLALVQ